MILHCSKMAASKEEMSTRKRKLQNKCSSNFEEKHEANDADMKKEGTFLDGSLVWIAIFSFTFLLYAFCRYRISVLPEPKTQQTNSPVDEFYESNAEKHLVELTQYGPRVVGSKENEIYAYNYILKELKSIQNKSHWKIEIDEQKVTGSFDIAFLSDFVSYYRDIKNIVALLEPEGGSEHSLLMSCHFDSSVDSPGKCHSKHLSHIGAVKAKPRLHIHTEPSLPSTQNIAGAQWLSGRVLDSRPKGCGFEPHRRHCVVVREQDTLIPA